MNKLATMIFGLAGFASAAVAQTNNVTSVVVSGTTGEPVSGASVVVTGTDIATTTDINGKFSIDAPKEYKTLTVSHNNLQPAVVNILPDPIVMREANSLMSGWGVEVGLASTTCSSDGDDDGVKRRTGLMLGVTYDYPIQAVPNLSVMGGLFYMSKGCKVDGYDESIKMNLNYLELQATAKYSYTLPVLNNDIKVFGLAGPYVAYGIGGKTDAGYFDTENKVSSFDILKRFDAGLVLGFGAEYKRFSLTCRWGIGMTNIFDADKLIDYSIEADYNDWGRSEFDSFEQFKEYITENNYYGKDDFDGFSIKNRSFMFTLGYRF